LQSKDFNLLVGSLTGDGAKFRNAMEELAQSNVSKGQELAHDQFIANKKLLAKQGFQFACRFPHRGWRYIP
jgi:hypothetical protein